MYFWNIERLKEDIKTNKLSEGNRFMYLFVFIFLTYSLTEIGFYMPLEGVNVWDYFESFFFVLIAIIGTYWCYVVNGGGDGEDFLGKYFALGWVVSIRMFVSFIPVLAGLFIYWFSQPLDSELDSTPIDTIPFILWYIVIYWRISVHIKQVNS